MPVRLDLTTARLRAGLTQRALAKRAGVALTVITDAEQGTARSIEFATLERLADTLHVEPASLIVTSDPPPKRKRGRPPKPRPSPPG